MKLLSPEWLLALGAIPVLMLFLSAAAAVRRRALARFFGPMAARLGLLGRVPLASWAACGALLLGLGLVVLALARPVYDPKPQTVQRAGRDVVFVLDVSRSMLAQDIRPNRLERAKLSVRDVLDVVEGDRVAIVAFAGSAVTRCPLTTDYAFARMMLDELSPDTVTRGGTAIGDAIRTATELLADDADGKGSIADAARFRDLFLFTDGEDHESDPVKAAAAAKEKGIRIVAIGLGSDTVGAPVPKAPLPSENADPRGPRQQPQSAGGYMDYGGERVQSKLDPESLRKVAAAAADGSQFFNVGTGNIELDRVYKRLMKNAERRQLEATETVKYTEAFQFALGAAVLLLCIEPVIHLARRRA